MSVTTRAQQYMKTAYTRVSEVASWDKDAASIYGGLCHNFPVMVRTCGLCQAVAFHHAKASGDGDRAKAHQRILDDVKAVLGLTAEQIPGLPVRDYVLKTRQLLAAWIYFKRFAESVLKVDSAASGKES